MTDNLKEINGLYARTKHLYEETCNNLDEYNWCLDRLEALGHPKIVISEKEYPKLMLYEYNEERFDGDVIG